MLLIEVGLRMRKERRRTEYERGNDPLCAIHACNGGEEWHR